MGIVIDLDVEMAKRKIKLHELALAVGITVQNLSVLKSDRAKTIRFSTLDKICKALSCQPGDILKFTEEKKPLFKAKNRMPKILEPQTNSEITTETSENMALPLFSNY
jgi:putative transcriptional regulator